MCTGHSLRKNGLPWNGTLGIVRIAGREKKTVCASSECEREAFCACPDFRRRTTSVRLSSAHIKDGKADARPSRMRWWLAPAFAACMVFSLPASSA